MQWLVVAVHGIQSKLVRQTLLQDLTEEHPTSCRQAVERVSVNGKRVLELWRQSRTCEASKQAGEKLTDRQAGRQAGGQAGGR